MLAFTRTLLRALVLNACLPMPSLSSSESIKPDDVDIPKPIPGNNYPLDSDDEILEANSAASFVLAGLDPIPAQRGAPPFQHSSPPPFILLRRQCLENGSNFCFGNLVDSCPGCRICCTSVSSKWCCDAQSSICCDDGRCCPVGGVCCGTGCCESGNTCHDGRCMDPVSL